MPGRATGACPRSRDELLLELVRADDARSTRTLTDLSRGAGNAALVDLLRPGRGRAWGGRRRTTRMTVAHGLADDRSDVTTQRDEAPATDEVVPLDTAPAPGATETIGPEVATSHPVAATSLADVATALAARPEAGHVAWSADMRFGASAGAIDAVEVSVTIDLEMPDWTPPPTMLPRARAEWHRWYAALLAHEQGHIDLVHAHFDGLAPRIIGRSPREGDRTFRAAKGALGRASTAYDRRTSHGRRQGTIMDVSIEIHELGEERRREETTTEGSREGAVPDVGDGDEG